MYGNTPTTSITRIAEPKRCISFGTSSTDNTRKNRTLVKRKYHRDDIRTVSIPPLSVFVHDAKHNKANAMPLPDSINFAPTEQAQVSVYIIAILH